jgi:serine protease
MPASPIRRGALAASIAILALGAGGWPAVGTPADAAPVPRAERGFVPDEVLVRMRGERRERLLETPSGVGVRRAAKRLEQDEDVAYAAPNYIAQISDRFIPDDPGSPGVPRGWTDDQWNFLGPPGGIGLPRAWEALRDQGRPGGARRNGERGPRIAVIDTGVAYRRAGAFSRSPDFRQGQFVAPRDFVDDDRLPLDEHGHGTFIAGTIGEQVDNGRAVTGIAYGTRLMPVRVLDNAGFGDAERVRAGIRWAMRHNARVINLSLQFGPEVTRCDQVPGVCEAIAKARRRGAIVIAAAGNGIPDNIGKPEVSFPGRVAVAVGAGTIRGCLARYSNYGEGLDLVAPGGGASAVGLGRRGCAPALGESADVVQLTLDAAASGDYSSFGLAREHGTSMASAHVSGVAGLVLASRVLARSGRRATPGRVERRLERTARELGDPLYYGAGLVNARRAIARK